MMHDYCERAVRGARYKLLDDGTWFAEIPGFDGVWANGNAVDACREELLSVLEEWLIFKLRDKDYIPGFCGSAL